MYSFKWLLFMVASLFLSDGHKRYYLNTSWTLQNANKSLTVPGTVPGGVYSDLQNAGIIDDIYYRFNDIAYRWVGNESWVYSTTFDLDNGILSKNNIRLLFEGLDTFCTVQLNNVTVATTNNMFVKYGVDIKSFVQARNNNLTLEFKSPITESKRLFDKQAKLYPVLPVCTPEVYNGECHVNHIRKMQASFAWDWGPAFPSIGIWKPVSIESYNSAVIQDVTVALTELDNAWNIDLTVFLTSDANKKISGSIQTQITTNIDDVTTSTDILGIADDNGEYSQTISIKIPKLTIDLWWPNGYGHQKLYQTKLIFYPDNMMEKSTKEIKIGFRTVELVQNKLEKGLSFYFKVNGLPIFAKGSNWIPANVLPEKGYNDTEIEYLLVSAKAAHMNMMRVWGGGVYESDTFYELTDRLGILIWQDFMFACSMYPADEEFLKTVKQEVTQQVRRLQHHASIALWAGNNENEAALRQNWYQTSSNFNQYKQDYVQLYVDTVRPIVIQYDKTRSYMTSSPSNGLESDMENYIARNPYDGHYGDTHFYNYILDGWNNNIYPKTRFASEYGYQSLPAYETLLSATNITDDLILDSKFLNARQHHLAGYNEMKLLIKKQLTLPKSNKDSYLKTFIYYSQISQAMSIKIETEHYRQWRSTIDSEGYGLTMGALYWQLNDVWQAPSWSSIDFKGKWKMLHYYAMKFFAPVLVSANITPDSELKVFISSDLKHTVLNAHLKIAAYKWDDFAPLKTEELNVTILPGLTAVFKQELLSTYLNDAGCGSNGLTKCFVYLTLETNDGNKISPDNFIFLKALKYAEGLKTPNLQFRVTDNPTVEQKIFHLTITTDRITPFVWFDTEIMGQFSENGFIQITKYKNITFVSKEPMTSRKLQSSLKITSLLSEEHL